MPKFVRKQFIHQHLLGFIAVAILSFGLRFWQLSRFDSLVFDEIYFVKFAKAYLAGTPQFDAHPPLGKYLIAAGIWLSDRLPLADSLASPLSYRWMNALVGGCIPLVVTGIAHTITQGSNAGSKADPNRRKHLIFVVLAGAFVATDGLFVTESRYALLNVYMVFFGLLGHWLWLQANLFSAQTQPNQIARRTLYRTLAGISLGAAIATKWNGLGYVLSLLIWELLAEGRSQAKNRSNQITFNRFFCSVLIYLVLIPAFTYCLIWLLHLYLTQESLVSVHIELFNFHRRLAPSSHPACSQWFTWPLLIKPISYWYAKSGPVAYTVSNLGNPALWWLSSAAVFLLSLEKVLRLSAASRSVTNNLSTYLLISYAANWLPWMLVGRCTFIYLYMPAAAFSFMMLAWLLSEWLYSSAKQSRTIGLVMLGAIALAFLFWLPLALGSPLTPDQLQVRWWLKTWI